MDINQIKGYFGTELRMAVVNDYDNGDGFITLFGSHTGLDLRCLSVQLRHCKPILHPLSDLTEPCLEGGKIPIVELAKRCLEAALITNVQFGNVSDTHNYASVRFDAVYDDSDDISAGFTYCKFSQEFFLRDKHDQNGYVVPQLVLFEMMYDMHMDLHGLIDKGEAIDINKLYE